jgi:hypothetical protein
MVDSTGRKVSYGFAIEEVRGTAEAAPDVWIPHLDQDFQDVPEKILNESALGVLDSYNDAILVKEHSEGKFDCKVQSNNFGYLLLAAFGLVETASGTAPGTYDHTFTPSNSNQSQSLTVFKYSPQQELAYALSVVSSIELEVAVGDYIKASISFMGKKGETVDITPAFSVEQEIEFTAKHLNLFMGNYGTSFATIKGGSAIPVKTLKINIDRKVEAYFETGSVTPTELHNKGWEVKVEVEKRFSDTTYKALNQADTMKAIVVQMVNDDQTIGTGGHPALEFQLPKVAVTDHSLSEGLEDVAEESFTLQGLFDSSVGNSIVAILTNIVSEYAAGS